MKRKKTSSNQVPFRGRKKVTTQTDQSSNETPTLVSPYSPWYYEIGRLAWATVLKHDILNQNHPICYTRWPVLLYPSWSVAMHSSGFFDSSKDLNKASIVDTSENDALPNSIRLQKCKKPVSLDHLRQNLVPARAALGPSMEKYNGKRSRVVAYFLGKPPPCWEWGGENSFEESKLSDLSYTCTQDDNSEDLTFTAARWGSVSVDCLVPYTIQSCKLTLQSCLESHHGHDNQTSIDYCREHTQVCPLNGIKHRQRLIQAMKEASIVCEKIEIDPTVIHPTCCKKHVQERRESNPSKQPNPVPSPTRNYNQTTKQINVIGEEMPESQSQFSQGLTVFLEKSTTNVSHLESRKADCEDVVVGSMPSPIHPLVPDAANRQTEIISESPCIQEQEMSPSKSPPSNTISVREEIKQRDADIHDHPTTVRPNTPWMYDRSNERIDSFNITHSQLDAASVLVNLFDKYSSDIRAVASETHHAENISVDAQNTESCVHKQLTALKILQQGDFGDSESCSLQRLSSEWSNHMSTSTVVTPQNDLKFP